MEMTVEELAKRIDAELAGDAKMFSRRINSVAPIKTAKQNNVTFIADSKHRAAIAESRADAVIVSEHIDNLTIPQLIVGNVNKALIETLKIFAPPLKIPVPGIHPSAIIAKDAKVDKEASIGERVVIDHGVVISSGTIIRSGCKIGQNTKIGQNCRIDSNVAIYHNCILGNNVIIQANSTIGSDGFGYALIDGAPRHIPHNGGVIIEDFVEIGANCCIDRAKFDNTIIGAGTKIDNLVQIGHNVVIGKCCLIAGQVGISGSTNIGDGVILGGQVGIVDNIEIGNGVMVGAQAGVVKSVPPGLKLAWTPAYEWNEAMRIMVHMRRLPNMAEQMKRLTKRIEELEASKDDKK
ncbi:MAG: UDP-3-O-(3-hydroxymyristoyl)glucosamine N-acyltransferase [Sedimentisphaerales bacterium]|jgi:UDP-3-O-[3-hydroxymyristoyl] glucosamine N-acyltransferase